jgi:hypothetical protein
MPEHSLAILLGSILRRVAMHLQVPARLRQPRTCQRSLASQYMCSTALLRWITAPWETFSRALVSTSVLRVQL